MIRFGVLGPLEIDCEGRAIAIPAGKQRIALAALLLNANRFVSPDHLIERMWDGGVPHDTRSTLHTHIARLRQALGPHGEDLTGTHNGGYILHASPRFA
ncbi:AfsR/SARP family transcriptional regulator [Allorhizocola rhizosphaerae]|uniref:AfsR/SARP family transcriptional regulator n=1 Tax=Allorhizocola rhizosphaerae TaxID=1872709 RepID=UPI0013C34061|nr:winged helix-turn-helix domain-containing protein [Allorhizocola rhizosphaerae]